MYGFLGKLFVGFMAVVAALGGVGLWQRKRSSAKDGAPSEQGEDGAMTQKTVENVLDLNDRFNRARYMDRDGE